MYVYLVADDCFRIVEHKICIVAVDKACDCCTEDNNSACSEPKQTSETVIKQVQKVPGSFLQSFLIDGDPEYLRFIHTTRKQNQSRIHMSLSRGVNRPLK